MKSYCKFQDEAHSMLEVLINWSLDCLDGGNYRLCKEVFLLQAKSMARSVRNEKVSEI